MDPWLKSIPLGVTSRGHNDWSLQLSIAERQHIGFGVGIQRSTQSRRRRTLFEGFLRAEFEYGIEGIDRSRCRSGIFERVLAHSSCLCPGTRRKAARPHVRNWRKAAEDGPELRFFELQTKVRLSSTDGLPRSLGGGQRASGSSTLTDSKLKSLKVNKQINVLLVS